MIGAVQHHMHEDIPERRGVFVARAAPICDRTLIPFRGQIGDELPVSGGILGGKLLALIEGEGWPHSELRRAAADARQPYVFRAKYVRVKILISLQHAVHRAKAFQNSRIGPRQVLEHLDEIISHWLPFVLSYGILSGERAASRHRANNAKNALSRFRRGDESLSTPIAMLVSAPNAAPPNTSNG